MLALVSKIALAGLTGVDSVQVVQVWSESQSFNCAVNILLDMGSGVGDRAISFKNAEATFGSN